MKRESLKVVVMMSAGVALTGCVSPQPERLPDPGIVWHNGRPPALRPDNPYLPALNAHVRRAQRQLKRGKPEHPFYLVWGAAGEGSRYRDDVALRKLALDEFDKATLARVAKPEAFWAIYSDLEALLLWQLEGRVPEEKIRTWQDRLRPSIEANIASITGESWVTIAANTLLQSTAILQLAVTSYGRTNPADPALVKWQEQARANLAKARMIQLSGGAFSYIRDSGPDPCYFAFDTAHLGRTYQLTGNPEVREALMRMAEWAGAATISGWLTPFSSPWWKHTVGSGGPYTGPEHVTALADDPVMRGVMAKRRGHIQPYTWSYASMYSWLPADGPVQPISDRCVFDRNANGPALRVGGWDVEMPARAWGDSSCGVSVATDKAITSCVNAVYLTANSGNDEPSKRTARHAYAMLGEAAMSSNSHVVGDGWIAAANAFDVHLGLYGDIPPEHSPWVRSDLWYADADGAVGVLQLCCAEPGRALGIELWVSTSAKKPAVIPDGVALADFTIAVTGAELGAGTVATGPTTIVWFPLVGAGARHYSAGQAFRAVVSIQRQGRPVLSIDPAEHRRGGGELLAIRKDGEIVATLLHNTTDRYLRHGSKNLAPGGLLAVE